MFAFFKLNQKERIGIITLFVAAIAIHFGYYIYERNQSVAPNFVVLDSTNYAWEQPNYRASKYEPNNYASSFFNEEQEANINAAVNNNVVLFNFDPNTASYSDWLKLGVAPYIANSINKFKSKGGKFYKPDDLNKIFLLPKDKAAALIPFVKIDVALLPQKNNYKEPIFSKEDMATITSYENSYVPKTINPVAINTGDTTAFMNLPTIGSGFAKRIINYRNQLGGFSTINQVQEVYGVTPEMFASIAPYLVLDPIPIKLLNINTATEEQLAKHPYIPKNIAKAIVNYKNQHGGKYNTVLELQNIMILDEPTFMKIKPYLTVN
jgi:competence protein ComEA